jgi:hypothetical protein
MPYRRQHRGFTPEATANIKRRYEETEEPVACIAKDFGVHRKTIEQLAKREGWLMRKQRGPRDLPPGLKLELDAENALRAVAPTMDESERLSMAERLERAVEKELAALEQAQAACGGELPTTSEGDSHARTIERLTGALYKIRHLRKPETVTSGLAEMDMPKDIDEFRHALALRIEAFVRRRRDERVPGPGDSGSAGVSQ